MTGPAVSSRCNLALRVAGKALGGAAATCPLPCLPEQIGDVLIDKLEYDCQEDGSADIEIRGLRGSGWGALGALLPRRAANITLSLSSRDVWTELPDLDLTPDLVAGVSRLTALTALALSVNWQDGDLPALRTLLEQAPGEC